MKKMIAYCGLDCEKCDAYLATVMEGCQTIAMIHDTNQAARETLKGGNA